MIMENTFLPLSQIPTFNLSVSKPLRCPLVPARCTVRSSTLAAAATAEAAGAKDVELLHDPVGVEDNLISPQITELARLGFPLDILKKAEAIPDKEAQRNIFSDLLRSARMVDLPVPAFHEYKTVLKLKDILSTSLFDGYSIGPTDDFPVQIQTLTELGIPQRVLEVVRPMPNWAAQRHILEDFLTSTHEVIHNAFDNPLPELKLKSIHRIFQHDYCDGVYGIAPTNAFASQIKKLAKFGISQRLLDMIERIPNEVAQCYVVEDFLSSSREVFRHAFHNHLTKLELKFVRGKFQHDPDVGGDSVRSDGSPDVRIDMPKEDLSAEQKYPYPQVVKSAADCIKEEGLAYLSNPSTNVPGLIWAKTTMEVAKILGYAFTAAGHGAWNYNNRLSRFFIKAGSIASATAVILALVLPLQPVVAWVVGLVAWLIVVAVILFLSN